MLTPLKNLKEHEVMIMECVNETKPLVIETDNAKYEIELGQI